MQAAEMFQVGPAEDSVRLIELTTPKEPNSKEILVKVIACPINPAEILLIEGKYAAIPTPPIQLGIEGAGIVSAIGKDIQDFKVGDKVMCLGRQNWREFVCAGATDFIALPPSIDLEQASMLKVNVATAHLMLTEYEDLSPGDWVIQNASNSGVGIDIIKMASGMGLNVVSVARREEVFDQLIQAGSKVVLKDDAELPSRVEQILKGEKIKLAIDAVAGKSTDRLAKCVSEGGTIVIYGLLSGEPCHINPHHLIFRNIRIKGFWLSNFLSKMNYYEKTKMYNKLSEHLLTNTINTKIAATYPLSDISEALKHAKKDARQGKILLKPCDKTKI